MTAPDPHAAAVQTVPEASDMASDDEFDTGCTDDCPDDCMADHAGEQ